jgi:uncharacterized protein (TIGR03083 family)
MLTRVTEIPRLGPRESSEVSAQLNASFLELVRGLSPEEWLGPTECVGWTPKDISCHLLGWFEALSSFPELVSQSRRGFARRKEFGNPTDAQNNIQVEDRRGLSTDEVLARLESSMPKAVARRRFIGSTFRYVPLYTGFLGGFTTLGYVANEIFPRDVLIHRMDILRGMGRELEPTSADRRIVADMVRDWFHRAHADAVLDLAGPLGDRFESGTAPVATIACDATDFVRFLAQRAGREVLTIDGDTAAVDRWLDVFFPI